MSHKQKKKEIMNIIQKLRGKTEPSMTNPNLMQLTKNLIMQAIYEFDRRFNVRQEFQQALENNKAYQFKVFSMWDNDSDEFYAGAFILTLPLHHQISIKKLLSDSA